MEIISLLPSPPQVLSLSLSLWRSAISGYIHKRRDRRLSLTDFDIDSETGFIPRKPLPRLSEPFEIWEKALSIAPETLSLGEDEDEDAIEKRVGSEQWRAEVRSWPVLNTECLCNDLRQLQRAHLVLAWLVHYFVHSIPPGDGNPICVPKSLAVPLVAVSRSLGMAPILTFADTVLWNWEPINPERPTTIENMCFQNLFSGTEDENNFYVASARSELRGAEIMHIIEDFCNLPDTTDMTLLSKTARDLIRLADIIDDISDIMHSIRGTCDPHVFYWFIRPWFEGSDAQGSGVGWEYEGVPNFKDLDLSGPSGGQSSVMQALDIFLDVDHKHQQRKNNPKGDVGFMERMRRYMPGRHSNFLARLAATPHPLRDLAIQTPMLQEPYDSVVTALKKFRDMHMRIACRYIVTMSRSNPSGRAGCPVNAMMQKLSRTPRAGEPVRGTGGNELCALLKAGRDATRRTLLRRKFGEGY